MARALWKGHITFGLVNIPVNLFTAESRNELHFTMLDSRNKSRIKYQRVNESTGEEVPWDQIVKAYEYEDDEFVVVTDEDFQRAAVEATQAVEIEDFVDASEIGYTYFEKPYCLTPGKKGEKGYVLLRESLKRTNKMGIARVVLRTKEYLCALAAQGDALILNVLRFHHELRDLSEYDFPRGSLEEYKVTDRELALSAQLVETMSAAWEPEKYKDDYYDKLKAWIEKKAREGDLAEPPAPAEKPVTAAVVDMMDLLKRSVEESKEKHKKAPAEQEEKAPPKRKRATG